MRILSKNNNVEQIKNRLNGKFEDTNSKPKFKQFFQSVLNITRDVMLFLVLATLGVVLVTALVVLFKDGISLLSVIQTGILGIVALILGWVYRLL